LVALRVRFLYGRRSSTSGKSKKAESKFCGPKSQEQFQILTEVRIALSASGLTEDKTHGIGPAPSGRWNKIP
jgi:hypothetical protein